MAQCSRPRSLGTGPIIRWTVNCFALPFGINFIFSCGLQRVHSLDPPFLVDMGDPIIQPPSRTDGAPLDIHGLVDS